MDFFGWGNREINDITFTLKTQKLATGVYSYLKKHVQFEYTISYGIHDQ